MGISGRVKRGIIDAKAQEVDACAISADGSSL